MKQMPKLVPVEHRTYEASCPLMTYNRDERVRAAYRQVCDASVNTFRASMQGVSQVKGENKYLVRVKDCFLELETTSDFCLRDPWEEGSAWIKLEVIGPRGKTSGLAEKVVSRWNDFAKVDHRCETEKVYRSELMNLDFPALAWKLYELKCYGRQE